MVFKEIIRNNDLWDVFSSEKFSVSNTGKQKEGYFCIIWGLDSVHLEEGKGEKKKKKSEELNLLNCAVSMKELLQKSI